MTEFAQIISWDVVQDALLDKDHPVSVITAPNFEDRSNAFIQKYCSEALRRELNNRWHIVTLQGKNEYDARDFIKARNCNRAYSSLTRSGLKDGQNLFLKQMLVPTSNEDLRALLGGATDGMGDDFTLVIDVSAIPRAFLWQLIFALSPSRSMTRGFRVPKNLWLVYSWAKSYPDTFEFETVGRIADSISARSLDEIVYRSDSMDAVVFTSGNTRSAYIAVDAFARTAHKKDFFVEIVHFVRPLGFSQSWHHLRLAQELLAKKPSTDRMQNSYVFHVEHALAWMRTLAKKSFQKLKQRGDHTFVIAPNGPKILSILAQFVADEYISAIMDDPKLVSQLSAQGKSPKDCVAVLTAQGSQFLSIYSLGTDGEITCAAVNGAKE